MGDGDEAPALSPQARVGAGAGAAVVAAVVLNPLDVIKTRIQAQAFTSTSAPVRTPSVSAAAACPCYTSTCYEQHRTICSSASSRASAAEALQRHLVLSRALAHQHGVTPLAVSDAGGASCHAPWPHRTWGVVCESPAVVRRVGPSMGGGAATAGVVYESMWHAFRQIVAQEGYGALWRGTGTSLLMSVPMVGIYMPLYDVLTEQWKGTGAAAPLLAGSAARAVACFAVAPFELMRTRLQATPGNGVRATDTLRSLVDANSTTGALRAVPRLWTGFTATLVRDVPFSALYWAMVEPLRHGILAQREQLHSLPGLPVVQTQSFVQPQQQQMELQQRLERQGYSSGDRSASTGSSSSATVSSSDSRRELTAHQHSSQQHKATCHHTAQDILLANITAGFIAGGAAAAVTTPFDVVKTRHQVNAGTEAAAAAAANGGRQSVVGTLRDVYRSEGMAGLFSGVRPRAFRAAPACAIVISCYELLKDWLA